MSCYRPLIGVPDGFTSSGKVHYNIRSSALSANFQVELDNNDHILIPCGHCIGCRLDYSRSWADRMMLELETAGSGVFVTLTYDNEHIKWSQFDEFDNPLYGTLDKRDCQLFMKRLRKHFRNKRIRFYLGGEYGENTLRPHYHAIIFGLSLDDFSDLVPHGCNELGDNYFVSNTLTDIWSNGFSLISDVSWKTCAYVARYVTKKLSGPYSIDYAFRNVIPEFALMSRKPGLGSDYLSLNPDCLDFNSINLSTPEGGLKIRIPKYYLKKLELTDKNRYDKMIADRKKFAEDSMVLKLQKTGLSYLDYLETCENNKLDSVKVLKRSKVL